MAQLAFGDRIPFWGVSIHLEEHCGKWKVIVLVDRSKNRADIDIVGLTDVARGMA